MIEIDVVFLPARDKSISSMFEAILIDHSLLEIRCWHNLQESSSSILHVQAHQEAQFHVARIELMLDKN